MEPQGRVLIADDDALDLRFTTELLSEEGYACDGAVDAYTATKLLHAEGYDLIVSDIRMPGNADLQFVKELQNLAPGVPVILLTGYPSVDSAVRSMQLSVSGYIVKPFEGEELLAQARLCIERYRLYQAVRTIRDRLGTWSRDLQLLEESLGSPSRDAPATTTQAVVSLTLRNLVDALFDMKALTEALTTRDEAAAPVARLLSHPRLESLEDAVREAVQVLEKTKRAFKSKELGLLRRKLESVLER